MACENLSNITGTLNSVKNEDYVDNKNVTYTEAITNFNDYKHNALKIKKVDRIAIPQNSLKNGLIATALDNQDSVYLSFRPLVNNRYNSESAEQTNDIKCSVASNKLENFEKPSISVFTSIYNNDLNNDYLCDNTCCTQKKDFEQKVSFDEVVIDGFSILSFGSKSDLLSYTKQNELEHPATLNNTDTNNNPPKRARRSGTVRRKHTKSYYKRSMFQPSNCTTSSVNTSESFGCPLYSISKLKDDRPTLFNGTDNDVRQSRIESATLQPSNSAMTNDYNDVDDDDNDDDDDDEEEEESKLKICEEDVATANVCHTDSLKIHIRTCGSHNCIVYPLPTKGKRKGFNNSSRCKKRLDGTGEMDDGLTDTDKLVPVDLICDNGADSAGGTDNKATMRLSTMADDFCKQYRPPSQHYYSRQEPITNNLTMNQSIDKQHRSDHPTRRAANFQFSVAALIADELDVSHDPPPPPLPPTFSHDDPKPNGLDIAAAVAHNFSTGCNLNVCSKPLSESNSQWGGISLVHPANGLSSSSSSSSYGIPFSPKLTIPHPSIFQHIIQTEPQLIHKLFANSYLYNMCTMNQSVYSGSPPVTSLQMPSTTAHQSNHHHHHHQVYDDVGHRLVKTTRTSSSSTTNLVFMTTATNTKSTTSVCGYADRTEHLPSFPLPTLINTNSKYPNNNSQVHPPQRETINLTYSSMITSNSVSSKPKENTPSFQAEYSKSVLSSAYADREFATNPASVKIRAKGFNHRSPPLNLRVSQQPIVHATTNSRSQASNAQTHNNAYGLSAPPLPAWESINLQVPKHLSGLDGFIGDGKLDNGVKCKRPNQLKGAPNDQVPIGSRFRLPQDQPRLNHSKLAPPFGSHTPQSVPHLPPAYSSTMLHQHVSFANSHPIGHHLNAAAPPHKCTLYRPIYPDKRYGRWADAHVRVANFIHRKRLFNGFYSASGTFQPFRPPIRPIVNRPQFPPHSQNLHLSNPIITNTNTNNRPSPALSHPSSLFHFNPNDAPQSNVRHFADLYAGRRLPEPNYPHSHPYRHAQPNTESDFWGHLFSEFMSNLSKEMHQSDSSQSMAHNQQSMLNKVYARMLQQRQNDTSHLSKLIGTPPNLGHQ